MKISPETFHALATGAGGPDAVAELRRLRDQRVPVLLLLVRDAAAARRHPEAVQAAAGYEVLTALDREHPAAVREALAYPTVSAWARRTLMHFRGGGTEGPGIHPGRLAALAAAAAHRAASDHAVPLLAADGTVLLPGLGRVVLPAPGATEYRAGRVGPVELRDGEPGWQPLRVLHTEHAGVRAEFRLDDLDPDRLTDGTEGWDFARWQDLLDEAWEILVPLHRTTGLEVGSAITALSPLAPGERGHTSATPPHAFGNIGLSTPPGAREFAETFAHEVQHTKLSALLESVRLTRKDDGSLHYAPWRPDPRPALPLLHGTYAYLGVTGFWRRQRTVESGDRALRAHAEFARWRAAAYEAATTLAGSGALTDDGAAFVGAMVRTLGAWQDEPVPADALQAARSAAAAHRTTWRQA